MKVLCVCEGNICRSPMMEALLRDELRKLGMENEVTVESAGMIKSLEDQEIHAFAQAELNARGINADSHRSRHIGRVGDPVDFDYILCVDDFTAERVREYCPLAADHVHVVNGDGEIGGIPNPYRMGRHSYHTCAQVIEDAMRPIAHSLKKMVVA